MAITKKAKAYHEKMFPGYVSSFFATDPEFIERFDNFAFDEVVNCDDLDDKTRFMAIVATLLGCQGTDEFRAMLPAAMNFGVTPVEIKEIVYQQFKKFGVNVFGVDASLSDMEGAMRAIACLSDFLFKTLGLQSTLTEIGIDDTNFKVMAKKACGGEVLQGFKPLTPEDVENIFKMCL